MRIQPKTPAKLNLLAAVAIACAALYSPYSHALALGQLRVLSALGEPLLAEIEIPQITPQEVAGLKGSLGSPAQFEAAGMVYHPSLREAVLSVGRRPDGRMFLRIAGTRPINEPFIELLVLARGAAEPVLRDYTLLFEPRAPLPAPIALGQARVLSARGEPLRAEIDVPQLGQGQAAGARVAVASAADFQAAGMPYNPSLRDLRMSMQQRPDGRTFMSVTSDQPFNQASLDLIVEANSPAGRTVRDYSLPVAAPQVAAPPAPAPQVAAAPTLSPREAAGPVTLAAPTPALSAPPAAPPAPVAIAPPSPAPVAAAPPTLAPVAVAPPAPGPVIAPPAPMAPAVVPPPPAPIAAAPVPAAPSVAPPAPAPVAAVPPPVVPAVLPPEAPPKPAPEVVAVAPPIPAPVAVPPPAPAAPTATSTPPTPPTVVASLPPGPSTTPVAAPERQVKVRSGDTLSRIARANKPANVSLDQMLIALLRANPNAFINGNVNLLKAGADLNIPGEEQAAAVPADQAATVLALQSKNFDEYRHRLAADAPHIGASPRQATGKIEATVSEKKPAAPTRNRLTLSSGAVGRASTEEKLIAARLALMAEERAAKLANEVNALSRLQGPTTASNADSAVPSAGAASAPNAAPVAPAR
jgi:pilus assembly protein FimV